MMVIAMNEYYGVPTISTEDFLAHYGIKGMRWGVRKAIATGNQKKLDRHFRKAAKKLKKLQDIGTNSKKYAAKATAYGVAAAGTGTLVINPRNELVSKYLRNVGLKAFLKAKTTKLPSKNIAKVTKYYSHGKNPTTGKREILSVVHDPVRNPAYDQAVAAKKAAQEKAVRINKAGQHYDWIRTGAGVATVGLGTAAGVNAYRAMHGKKYRQKAMNFRNEMDRVFAGTKYAGKYTVQKKAKKRRK